jgi:glycyl-tRNA synthetase alpha chain
MARRTYQDIIIALERYWADYGCTLMTPYHTEVAAGTMNPATLLRSLGPKPWQTGYLEPVIRPLDGRYGENPMRFQHYFQYQVLLKPTPDDVLQLYVDSLRAMGLETEKHDIRFVEDDWEQPTVGAWGLGWEVWADGMEVTQFTYFQQVAGMELDLIPAEITYGLDRLAMVIQEKPTVFDLEWAPGITWGDVFKENERQWSHYNFEEADVDMLMRHFEDYERQARHLIERSLPLPAYDMILKANHAFNLLDARGAISVTERAAYIGRVRNLVREVGKIYLEQQEQDEGEHAAAAV